MRWEVGGGRVLRQPGQVRKEAALTIRNRVAVQPPFKSYDFCSPHFLMIIFLVACKSG